MLSQLVLNLLAEILMEFTEKNEYKTVLISYKHIEANLYKMGFICMDGEAGRCALGPCGGFYKLPVPDI